MKILNRMRREDHIRNLASAATCRRYAIGTRGMDVSALFVADAKSALSWARRDRGYATQAGWKLP